MSVSQQKKAPLKNNETQKAFSKGRRGKNIQFQSSVVKQIKEADKKSWRTIIRGNTCGNRPSDRSAPVVFGCLVIVVRSSIAFQTSHVLWQGQVVAVRGSYWEKHSPQSESAQLCCLKSEAGWWVLLLWPCSESLSTAPWTPRLPPANTDTTSG